MLTARKSVSRSEQLGHLSRGRRCHRHHPVHGLLVKRRGYLQAGRRHAAHHLGRLLHRPVHPARVDALRRIGQEEIHAHPGRSTARRLLFTGRWPLVTESLLQHRQQQFLRRPRIGGRLQHHQHAGMDVAGDGLAGRDQETHVGVAALVERRGHADDGHVAVGQNAVVGGGGEGGGGRMVNGQWCEPVGGDVADVGAALTDGVHFVGVDVDANHGEAAFGESDGQRQAYVAKADHGDDGAVVANFDEQLVFHGLAVGRCWLRRLAPRLHLVEINDCSCRTN